MAIVRTRRIIDDAGAETVIAAAERHALEHGHRVVIAVVDPWGEVVLLRRTPGAQIASSRVAVDKARTAAIFVRPSREMEEQVTGGRLGALALHGASALTGGIPLTVDGEVVGAIGTSGETPDEDEAVSLAGAAADFSVTEVPALTYEGARMAAEAAGEEAARRGVAPVISAVDAGGALMFLVRPDLAQVASVEVTTDKARTAAIYRRPSKDFEDQASSGRPSALHLARAVPLQGGIPIEHDGQVIGAIGVSGATSADEDAELAQIGAARRVGRAGRPEQQRPRGAHSSRPPPWSSASAPAACCSTSRPTRSTPAPRGAGRGRVPRARGRRDARRRRQRDRDPRRRAARAAGGRPRRAAGGGRRRRRAPRAPRGRRARDPQRRRRTSSSTSRIRSSTSSSRWRHDRRGRTPGRRARQLGCPGRPSCSPGAPTRSSTCRPTAGCALVGGQWRYSDARVEEIDFVALAGPGAPDPLGPGDVPNRTYDVVPHAEGADFDDSGWRALAPEETMRRLANGRVCFNWYRIEVDDPGARRRRSTRPAPPSSSRSSSTTTPRSG